MKHSLFLIIIAKWEADCVSRLRNGDNATKTRALIRLFSMPVVNVCANVVVSPDGRLEDSFVFVVRGA